MNPLQEAHPDSEYRCQGRGQGGQPQCVHLSMEGLVLEGNNPYEHTPELVKGVDRCPRCGGKAKVDANRSKATRIYKIQTLEKEIQAQLENGQLKSLRQEVALTRTLLQEMLNEAVGHEQGSRYGIMIHSPQVERLLTRVESLVMNCQKLEEKSDAQLDVTEAVQFAERLGAIVMEYVPEELQEEASLALETALRED